MRIALTIALLVAFPVVIRAQEQKLNPSVPNLNIKERYDRFSDLSSVIVQIPVMETVVDLGGGSVYAKPGRSLDLVVLGIYEGQDSRKAIPKVTIVINSRSDEWIYLRSTNLLQVIIDGTSRATLGEMKRGNSEVLGRGRGVLEQLVLQVPFPVIEQLAKAKKLEMRIGSDEFELKSPQLADLQEWVNKFPAAKSAKK